MNRMDDSAGSRGGLRNRKFSPQPESMPLSFAVEPRAVAGAVPASTSLPESPQPLQSEFSFQPASGQPEPKTSSIQQTGKRAPQRIPSWLERAELILRVLLRMYIGLAVFYAPWSHVFWDQNPIFAQFPTLSAFATSGAVRGIVSGIGLLNLWIALQDAIHHRNK